MAIDSADLSQALLPRKSWRGTKNTLASVGMVAAVIIVMIPLGLVLYSIISKGAGVLSWDFLTKDIPPTRRKGPGMGPAVYGTIIITAAATVMAVPLGILGAVYLHEYGGQSRPARIIRFLANVMTGVPSIVMGLFVYVIFTLRFGLSGIGGSLALACLMLPVVIRPTEEMLRLVPSHLREASYALGTRKGRTILTVVLPSALPGIVSGCLLAVARAAGETAPLLFTIGIVTKVNSNVFSGPNTSLSAQIFKNASQTLPGPQERGWGAAFTLVAITFLFTVIARLVTASYQKRR
jgi:phosphate transport system permease protein